MITIQTGKIKAISEVLGTLIREKDLSRKQKYWFYRFTNKFAPELDAYNKIYEEMANEYCDKDESGKPVFLDAEGNIVATNTGRISVKGRMDELNQALLGLNKQSVNIEFDKIKINIDDLPESITSQMMLVLDDIIEFTDDAQPPLHIAGIETV